MCIFPPKKVRFCPVFLRLPAASLWPDRRQHVFHHLKPNSEYSLLLLADNVSRHATSVKTDFGQWTLILGSGLPTNTESKTTNSLLQTRLPWRPQPRRRCCWRLSSSSPSSCPGPREPLAVIVLRSSSPPQFIAIVFCRRANVKMQVALGPRERLEQQNGRLADEPNLPGHRIRLHSQFNYRGLPRSLV